MPEGSEKPAPAERLVSMTRAQRLTRVFRIDVVANNLRRGIGHESHACSLHPDRHGDAERLIGIVALTG
jgi:hypothetical protein